MSTDFDKPMKDVVIVISDSHEGDEGAHYSSSKVFRFDLVGRDEDFIRYIMDYQPAGDHTGIIEGEKLVAEVNDGQ